MTESSKKVGVVTLYGIADVATKHVSIMDE